MRESDPDFSIPSWDNIDEDTIERVGSAVIKTQHLSVRNHTSKKEQAKQKKMRAACEETRRSILIYGLTRLMEKRKPLFPNMILKRKA